MSKSIATQCTLWNEVPRVPSTLTTVELVPHRNKLNELTGESLRLLPITAGKDKAGNAKPSLKLQNPNMTTAQLKELAKSQGMEMKSYLGNIAIALVQNPDVVGVAPRIGRAGRVSLVFKKVTPQIDCLTDEELAAEMGQTVAWVQKNRKAKAVTVELNMAAAPESQKPAPRSRAKAGNVIAAPVSTPAPAA